MRFCSGAAVVVAAAFVASASFAADPCEPWPGERAPLPATTDADPFLARWAELRATELTELARHWGPTHPATAAALHAHAACLDPRRQVVRAETVRIHRSLRAGALREAITLATSGTLPPSDRRSGATRRAGPAPIRFQTSRSPAAPSRVVDEPAVPAANAPADSSVPPAEDAADLPLPVADAAVDLEVPPPEAAPAFEFSASPSPEPPPAAVDLPPAAEAPPLVWEGANEEVTVASLTSPDPGAADGLTTDDPVERPDAPGRAAPGLDPASGEPVSSDPVSGDPLSSELAPALGSGESTEREADERQDPVGELIVGIQADRPEVANPGFVSPPAAGPASAERDDPEQEFATSQVPPSEPRGSESPGLESLGLEAPGSESLGTASLGTESPGLESLGLDSPATESLRSESPRSESLGSESPGLESLGLEPHGPEAAGLESAGLESAGSDSDLLDFRPELEAAPASERGEPADAPPVGSAEGVLLSSRGASTDAFPTRPSLPGPEDVDTIAPDAAAPAPAPSLPDPVLSGREFALAEDGLARPEVGAASAPEVPSPRQESLEAPSAGTPARPDVAAAPPVPTRSTSGATEGSTSPRLGDSPEPPRVAALVPDAAAEPVSSEPEASAQLDAIRESVHSARFEAALVAIEELRPGLEAAGDAAGRADLEVLAATATLALGEEGEARLHFVEALKAQPELELDPLEHSPKVRRLFQAVQREVLE